MCELLYSRSMAVAFGDYIVMHGRIFATTKRLYLYVMNFLFVYVVWLDLIEGSRKAPRYYTEASGSRDRSPLLKDSSA